MHKLFLSTYISASFHLQLSIVKNIERIGDHVGTNPEWMLIYGKKTNARKMSIDIEQTQIHGCEGVTAPKMPNHERSAMQDK